MMSLTGIHKKFFPLMPLSRGKTGKKYPRGFTLLEVMITTAVLALGATLIYQSFFMAVDSYSYCATLLKITPWMDEKIWQAQDEVRRSGLAAVIPAGGHLEINNKNIKWSLACNPLDNTGGLYEIDLVAFWPQGVREIKLSRSAYALYSEK